MPATSIKRAAVVVLVAVATQSVSAPASAGETGFASMHDQRREKGRICMSEHWHYGSGSGSTRKAAEADAIKSWADFTAFEYGSTWARFSRAASKKMSCSQGSTWSCQVEARPCK